MIQPTEKLVKAVCYNLNPELVDHCSMLNIYHTSFTSKLIFCSTGFAELKPHDADKFSTFMNMESA